MCTAFTTITAPLMEFEIRNILQGATGTGTIDRVITIKQKTVTISKPVNINTGFN
jgi:hypothetical protein